MTLSLTHTNLVNDFKHLLALTSHTRNLRNLQPYQVHSMLQRLVRMRAIDYDYDSMAEYSVRVGGQVGYIDVMWAAYDTPVVAIEIDSSYRKKSVEKLLAVNAPIKVWIYYGDFDGYFPDDIIVVRGSV